MTHPPTPLILCEEIVQTALSHTFSTRFLRYGGSKSGFSISARAMISKKLKLFQNWTPRCSINWSSTSEEEGVGGGVGDTAKAGLLAS